MVEDRCESPDFSYKSRPRFSHAIIRGLSIAVILLGISCIGLGITILSVVLAKKCMVDFEYWRRRYDEPPVTIPDICQYQMTLLSPGLWSGLEFVGSGVIGLLAARKKSSSLVCKFDMSTYPTGCTLAMAGNFDYFYMYNPYPISLHVLDSVLAFLCGVVFIISWVKFSLACYALCCCHQLHASQNAQESTQYQRLMTDNSQATGISGMYGNTHVRKIVSEDSEASSSSRMNRNQIAEDLPGPTSTSLHTRLLPPETA